MKELPNKESRDALRMETEYRQLTRSASVYELPVFTWETVWEPEAKEGKHTEAQLATGGFYNLFLRNDILFSQR